MNAGKICPKGKECKGFNAFSMLMSSDITGYLFVRETYKITFIPLKRISKKAYKKGNGTAIWLLQGEGHPGVGPVVKLKAAENTKQCHTQRYKV